MLGSASRELAFWKKVDDAKGKGFPLVRLGDEILEHAGKGVYMVVVPRSQSPGKEKPDYAPVKPR